MYAHAKLPAAETSSMSSRPLVLITLNALQQIMILSRLINIFPKLKQKQAKKSCRYWCRPGGLSAAHFLRLEGHQVEIFEAAPKSGGWLRYGIPEYRLPNEILDEEVKNITDLGVKIHYNSKFGGETVSYEKIKTDFNATILSIGSQKGTLVGCTGDDAENVLRGG